MSTPDFKISIAKERIHDLKTVTYPGTIVIVDTPEHAEQAVSDILKHAVVGFDTETRPTFTRGKHNKVALMQIATDDLCYLFRLNKIGMPECLHRFLAAPGTQKIGLSLKDDFFVMHRSGDFEPQGFVDLQPFVRQWHIADCSLQRIYAIVFGERISKSQRLTNWEAPNLTPAQQAYAAIDAWACLKIWRTLTSGAFHPEQSPYIVRDDVPV